MTVAYSCGHTEERKVYRTRQAGFLTSCLEERVCKACFRTLEEHDTFTSSRAIGLPMLSGTDKAVRWAYALRYKWIMGFIGLNPTLRGEAVDACGRRRSASWWIDHRYHLDDEMGSNVLETAAIPF